LSIQERVDEAELGYRCGDLGDLIIRVRSLIADLGDQPLGRRCRLASGISNL
jgi:hypothetical protein